MQVKFISSVYLWLPETVRKFRQEKKNSSNYLKKKKKSLLERSSYLSISKIKFDIQAKRSRHFSAEYIDIHYLSQKGTTAIKVYIIFSKGKEIKFSTIEKVHIDIKILIMKWLRCLTWWKKKKNPSTKFKNLSRIHKQSLRCLSFNLKKKKMKFLMHLTAERMPRTIMCSLRQVILARILKAKSEKLNLGDNMLQDNIHKIQKDLNK